MLKPKLENLNDEQLMATNLLLSYFKIDNRPADELVTKGQKVIFYNLVFRPEKELVVLCCTQYGKSLITALAVLMLSCIEGILVAIVAPNKEKAKIIMRYYIEHLGDDKIFYSQLEKNTRLERLRQEESKQRIVLKNGGGAYVLSAGENSILKSFQSAMGMGARVVILDEAGLITDKTESSIFRMVAGQSDEYFYAKLGNPFYGESPYTHLKSDWENPDIKSIFIDYHVALKEGRYSEKFVERALKKPLAGILYECEFPDISVIDERGFRTLVMSKDIKRKSEEELKKLWEKEKEDIGLGVDIGAGGDYNVYCLRKGRVAFFWNWNKSSDTMVNVEEILRVKKEYGIEDENIAIDDVGVGRGVSDRLKELGHRVNGVAVGEKARDSETFFNLKAELYWDVKSWIPNAFVSEQEGWEQLTWIKYKTHRGERRIQVEAKEEMKKRTGGKSSDFADAVSLTFYRPAFVGIV
jgi:hypothetical protein